MPIMPERDKILDEMVSTFERIVNKIHMMERIPKDFGTGELLHLGQRICERHEMFHSESLSEYFEDITFGQAAIFKEILAKIDDYADMKTKKRA